MFFIVEYYRCININHTIIINIVIISHAAGNKINGKKAKKVEDLNRQEVKRFKREIKYKIKENVDLEEYEMDYCDEWNIKYAVEDA